MRWTASSLAGRSPPRAGLRWIVAACDVVRLRTTMARALCLRSCPAVAVTAATCPTAIPRGRSADAAGSGTEGSASSGTAFGAGCVVGVGEAGSGVGGAASGTTGSAETVMAVGRAGAGVGGSAPSGTAEGAGAVVGDGGTGVCCVGAGSTALGAPELAAGMAGWAGS